MMSHSSGKPRGAGRQESKKLGKKVEGRKRPTGTKKRRSAKSKRGGPGQEPIPPNAVVSLTPYGRQFYNQLLQAASNEAGCAITGQDLLEVLRRVKAETGQADPQFVDPVIMECFKNHLRALANERRKPT